MAHDLGNYMGANQRLLLALAKYPQLRVVEEPAVLREDWPGGPVLVCTVRLYRDPDDQLPVIASVTEQIPGKTPYTRGSEMMNGFTSALGRACGYLGFGIDGSIATQEEVKASMAREQSRNQPQTDDIPETNWSGPSDKQLRLLKALGFSGPTPATMRDASSLIEKLKAAGGHDD